MMEFGEIVALLLTFSVLSLILYKDTPFFKFAVNTFLGLTVGNIAVVATNSIRGSVIDKISLGDYIYIVPLILGLLIFTRLSVDYKNLSRISIALMFGTGTGLGLARTWHSGVSRHLEACVKPFLGSPDMFTVFSGLILIIGVISSMMYFQFTHYYNKPYLQKIHKVGRIFIMISLGAQFGAIILTRLATLSGRIYFIVKTLGLI